MQSDPGLAPLRQRVSSERTKILSRFRERLDSLETISALADHLDGIITSLAEESLQPERVGLFSLGGCGRRQVFPFSDVDLLFLHSEENPGRDLEKGIGRVVGRLYDLGRSVGQQVWSIQHARQIDLEELAFLLALMDGRFLWGAPEWEDSFCGIRGDLLARHGQGLLSAIRQLTEERHGDHDNTIYELEPDVKHSPGGLRDHLVIHWMTELSESSPLQPYDLDQLEKSFSFLAKARIALHVIRRRDHNRLTHPLQEQVAELLGFGGDPHSSSESLMKEYFLHARVVQRACLTALRHPGTRDEIDLDVPPKTLHDTLQVFLDLKQGGVLSPRASGQIRDVLDLDGGPGRFPPLRSLLMDILTPDPKLYAVLTEMYELGLLEHLFPEFGTIKARVIRDFYHRYTVDEHTLLAIKAVCDLLGGEDTVDGRFRELLLEMETPSILTLALLLHDVGKSQQGSHTEASAQMAEQALGRFRFPREARLQVTFLIRQHLAMSQLAFRRNVDDPAVAAQLADLVSTVSNLRLLTLLTYADVKAVAPGILSDWKRDLLWQLYVETHSRLTRGFGQAVIDEVPDLVGPTAALPEDLDPDDLKTFLRGLPRHYLSNTEPREIFEHCRMARRLHKRGEPQLKLRRREGHYELCVLAADRRRVFARIVGVLSSFGVNILRGYALSNEQRTILDIFEFTDSARRLERNPSERHSLRKLLKQAILGKRDVARLLVGRERSFLLQPVLPDFDPRIYFEDSSGSPSTIMEIVAPDSPGLLYRISREVADAGCNIDLALISTEGTKAIDVFYLTLDGKGLPEDFRASLLDRIRRVVEL